MGHQGTKGPGLVGMIAWAASIVFLFGFVAGAAMGVLAFIAAACVCVAMLAYGAPAHGRSGSASRGRYGG